MQIFNHLTESNLPVVIIWLIITYGATLGACAIDLASGLYKAYSAGKARTSTMLRKTCTKAQHYFLPMLCLSFADILASVIIAFPPFSMLWAAFCIACEYKSVMEKSSTKEQIAEAANTMSVVIKNKEDIANILLETLKQMNNENTTNT